MQWVIGVVSLQIGNILATNYRGEVRSLHLGDPVFADDNIDIPANSRLEIDLYNGETVYLNESLHQSVQSKYATSDIEVPVLLSDSVRVQGSSFNLSTYDFSNLHREQHTNFTLVDRSALEINPTAGFDVTTSNAFPDINSRELEDPAKIKPRTNGSINGIYDDQYPTLGDIGHKGYSNDTSPLLMGVLSQSLTPIEHLQVLRNGRIIGIATVSGTSWQFQDSSLDPAHEYQYTVQVVRPGDLLGQLSPIFTINIDNKAPTQTATITDIHDDVVPNIHTVADLGVSHDTSPQLNGSLTTSLQAGEQLNIIRDGAIIGQASVINTSWSFQDTGLSTGNTYVYTSQIIDAASNLGALSNTYSIIIDTNAPTQNVSITDIQDDISLVLGTVLNGGATNDTAPLLNGTLSATLLAGENVIILRDAVVIGLASVTGTSWSYYDTGLVDGSSYAYTAQVVDTASNIGPLSNTYTIAIDISAPTQVIAITTILDNFSPYTGNVSNGATTNDLSPQIIGTLDNPLAAGEVIDIYRDGSLLGQASTIGLAWSYDDSGLTDANNYDYTALVRDSAGNISALSNSYTINTDISAPLQTLSITDIQDNQLPASGTIADGGITNDTTPLLNGTLSFALLSGESVNIFRDGVIIGQASVTTTNWSYTDTGLIDGNSYIYTAQVIDAASNISALSSTYTINLDTSAPTQTPSIVDIQDDVGPITGTVANGDTTNDTAPVLTGTLSAALLAGESLNILRNGTVIGQASVTSTSWSYNDTGLIDGNNYIYTTQIIDAASNTGLLSTIYSIDVDTSAPTQTVTITNVIDDIPLFLGNVTNGGFTNDLSPAIIGTIDVTLATNEVLDIFRDGALIGQASVIGLAWSYNDSGLIDANSYVYTAQVRDSAGNTGGISPSYTINTDTIAPIQSVVITDIQDDVGSLLGTIINGGITNDTTPVLNGTLSTTLQAGESLNILRFGVVIGQATVSGTTWSYADSGLIDGNSYIYTAQVIDSASNAGGISGSYTINIDSSAPTQTATITNIQDNVSPIIAGIGNGGTTNDTTPVLNGTLSALLATAEVLNILRDGVIIGQASVTTTSWDYNDSGLIDGNSYTYTTQIIDDAGNTGAELSPYIINIDTTAPSQTVTITDIQDNVAPQTGTIADGGSSNDLSPQINGNLDSALAANEVVNVLRDGFVIGQAVVTGTNWSYDDAALTDLTNYTYTAEVVDAAGNTGSTSNSYDINTDTAASSAPSLVSVLDDVGGSQGSIANGATTDDQRPEFTVNLPADAVAGDILILYNNSTAIGSHVLTALDIVNVLVRVTPSSNLADGSYNLSAAITDAAGNISSSSASSSLTVDTYDEVSAFISAVTSGSARWGGNGGAHITDPHVNVSGLPAGSVVKLFVGSHGEVGSLTVSVNGGNGGFSVTGNFPMTPGQNVHATVTYGGTTRFVHIGHEFLSPNNHDISFSSPLILDLDQDGIETINYSQGVTFDINADGTEEQTGWVSADDALLVLDLNQDGLINNASELFGEHMLKADGNKASDGFDALTEYDANKDGVIDSEDQIFSQLQLWVDANSDGISQTDELFSLEELGVSQLSLFSEQVSIDNNGNTTALEGYYIDADGNQQSLSDVWFSYIDNSATAQAENLIVDATDNLQFVSDAISKLSMEGIDTSPLDTFNFQLYYNTDQSLSLTDLLETDSGDEISADNAEDIFRYIFSHYTSSAILTQANEHDTQTSEPTSLFLQNLAIFSNEQHQIIDKLLADVEVSM